MLSGFKTASAHHRMNRGRSKCKIIYGVILRRQVRLGIFASHGALMQVPEGSPAA